MSSFRRFDDMSARVFVHPSVFVGDNHLSLAREFSERGMDVMVFDHPPRPVRAGEAKRRFACLHEVVRAIPALPGVFSRMDGVVFSTNPLLA